MLNPYAIMYDSTMDIYRHIEKKDGAFDQSDEVLVSSGIKCRYSISEQNIVGSPVPSLNGTNQLFCGLGTNIKSGDNLIVTMRTGKTAELTVGDVHPYSFQYQCEVEKRENA